MPGLWILGTLALGLIALPRLPRLAVAVFGGRRIGDRAVARQPDRIHLQRAGEHVWLRPETAEPLARALLGAGFRDAGVHTVDEMPGVIVRLLVEPVEAWMASVYEHPKAGQWVEIAQTYEGGGGRSVTSMPDPGLDPRPGFTTDHLAQAPVGTLLARMRARKAAGTPLWVSTEKAAERFEQGYAEAIAWRKSHGVSRREVVQVALKKAA